MPVGHIDHKRRSRLQRSAATRHSLAVNLSDALKRIEHLETALGWFLKDPRFTVSVGGNPRVVETMLANAKAVLSPKNNFV